jgi:hypothetical protein
MIEPVLSHVAALKLLRVSAIRSLKRRGEHAQTGDRGEISNLPGSSILPAKRLGSCPKDFWTDFKETYKRLFGAAPWLALDIVST